MIITEVISIKDYNSFIFNGSYDTGLSLIMEMEKTLIESTKILYEDSQDVIDYKSFINFEKQYTIDYNNLVTGQLYLPINYRGAPFQQTIILDVPQNNIKFIKSDNNSLQFSNGRKKLDFTKSNTNAKGTLETLIFKNKSEADNHILTLKLKFSEWDIKIRYL